MRKVKTALAAVVLAGSIAGGTYAFFGSPLVPTAQAKWHDHPKLEAAYNSIKDAKDYLESSPSDFHGHKKSAIEAINVAMHHLRLCAEEEALPSADTENAPFAEHPRLHTAREHLKVARDFLHDSHENFHGHKEEAVKALDVAIREIDKCLE
ncbi:MAG TPA: hypothetical protein VFE47_27775 [Tepidisphaeraceae bacterium]|jgi:hypothetical protein|nr:hypothetical protein [Tepidisphaeraceae bacterium]